MSLNFVHLEYGTKWVEDGHVVRMTMFESVSSNNPAIQEKQLKLWQESIKLLDDQMVNNIPKNHQGYDRMLSNKQIPRPTQVLVTTENPDFARLITDLGLLTRPDGQVTNWNNLVNLARHGHILKTWRSLAQSKAWYTGK